MKRQQTLRTALVVGSLGAMLAACGNGVTDVGASSDLPLSGQRLVYVGYGGDAAVAATKGWLEPFAEKTGVQYVADSPSDGAKIKAMVDSGRTTWDVVLIDPGTGGRGCGTLFETRPSSLDVSEIDPKYVTDECGVPVSLEALALVYNKELYGDNPPTSTADFLDTERFPGQRHILNYALGGVEPLLAADGVPPEAIYPIDFGRVEKIVRALGSDLTFDPTLAQQGEVLSSGNFGMCLCYTGRAALKAAAGADIGVVFDKTYITWDAVYAVKGSKSPEAQLEFQQFVATADGQIPYYTYLPYSPTIKGANLDVQEAFKPFMPDFNADKISETYVTDVKWWNENSASALDSWTKLTAG